MARTDPHSFRDDNQPDIEHVDWRAAIDFRSQTIAANVTLRLARPSEGGPLDLDTRDLAIEEVHEGEGRALAWDKSEPVAILGARLRIELPAGTRVVTIRYRTSPAASALQWLAPAQTAGGVSPFLFSQCQAIHARSIVPLQDTPAVRVRYRAELVVPKGLRALMAAAHVSRDVRAESAVETWEMPQPIPPYLLALAVGDLASRDVGPRSRVWAEPSIVERAAWEFDGVDHMLKVAESLFGPYDWERFDVLTMPPSFPYGGMENPRLTFLTPTLLAGDRSLVSVVAHELAHSWTGNLVSNANAEHFWLNEGFTVFAERRIVEALEGKERAALDAALGRRALDGAVKRFIDGGHPELTRLRPSLEGVDPDDAFSIVPYEKGFLLLRALEEAAGREAFDAFLREYIARFRFRAITSDDFLALLEEKLPDAAHKVDPRAWLDGEGVPDSAPAPRSERLDTIAKIGNALPDRAAANAWAPMEWQLYLEALPRPSPEIVKSLDETYRLTASTNYEVLVTWLELALRSGHAPAKARVTEVLAAVGRMKYLRPLYRALVETDPESAKSTYAACKAGYHPIARQIVEGVLKGSVG